MRAWRLLPLIQLLSILLLAEPGRSQAPGLAVPEKMPLAQDHEPGPAVEAPGLPRSEIANPDLHVRLAAQFVSTREEHGLFREEDRPYIRFLSFWATPFQKLAIRRALLNIWVQQMSFSPAPRPLREVLGSKGRLVWLDLRWFYWNAQAWQSVAERDFYIAEPWVDHAHAELLRKELYAPNSEKALKGREIAAGQGKVRTEMILPVVSMMTAEQFLRDTFETERVDSYYDLLFSRERFPGEAFTWREETRNIRYDGPGDLIYPDDTGRTIPAEKLVPGTRYAMPLRFKVYSHGAREFVNFPANLQDWEKAFLVDRVREGLRERKIDLDFGAVVDGGLDNPQDGSMVALHNRLIVNIKGPISWHMETYDVKEVVGVKDFTESLIYAGEKFQPGQGARAKRDAGEILSYLPNGGQAGLLIDGVGKRVEFAGEDVAVQEGSTTKDKRVRNIASCFECHAPTGGYILPNDLINRALRDGVEILHKDPLQQTRTEAFFRNYAHRVKGVQEEYLALVSEMTRGFDQREGWTGARFAKEIGAFRQQYDAPLTLEDCAAEVGVPKEVMETLLLRLPFNRAKLLVRGYPVPRRTWEKDFYPNLQILRAALVRENKYPPTIEKKAYKEN